MARVVTNENRKLCVRRGKTTSRFVRINLDNDSGTIVCVADTLQPPVRKPLLIRAKKKYQRDLHSVPMKD